MMKKVFVAASVLLVILIVVLADTEKMPWFIAAIYNYPYGDKAGHFLLMGGFAVIVNLNLIKADEREIWKKAIFMNLMISLVFTLEEFSQRLFPNRTFSLIDLTCSLMGIWVMGLMSIKLRARSQARDRQVIDKSIYQ